MLADVSPLTLAVVTVGILLVLLMFATMPVFVGLGAAAIIGLLLVGKTNQVGGLVNTVFSGSTSFELIAVPMFVLLGEFLVYGGLGGDLYEAFNRWFSRVPGGLAIACIWAGAVFGAMCGAAAPGTATIGILAIPEMEKRGYPPSLTIGPVAVCGGLAMLIPPSILMIVYGSMTGLSVAKLFLAGLAPGILLVIIYSIYIVLQARFTRKGYVPTFGVSWSDRFVIAKDAYPVIFIVLATLGSIYMGIATPTEAGALGAVAALVLSLVRRRVKRDNFIKSLKATVITSGVIYIIIVFAHALGFTLTSLGIPPAVAEFIVGVAGGSKYIVFAMIYVMYLLLGTIMEGSGMMVLTLPIVLPIMVAVGFDPVWFAAVFVMTIESATITPPVGINLYVMKVIAPQYSINKIAWNCLPYVGLQTLGGVILLIFPQIVLWLPNMIK